MSLSTYLQKRELTYETFGQMIGVTGTAIYRYAKGIRIPNPRVMEKIIQVTNGAVTANDFYDLSIDSSSCKTEANGEQYDG